MATAERAICLLLLRLSCLREIGALCLLNHFLRVIMGVHIEVILLTNFVPKVAKLTMKFQRFKKVSLETDMKS